MDRRFWISGVVMGVVSLIMGFIVHGTLLNADYMKLAHLYRSPQESEQYMHFMLLAHLLIGFGFTWIYRQGLAAGKSAIGQGLRFGLGVCVLMTIPGYLIYYVVMPLPGALPIKQIAFDVPAVLLMGVIVALLNPPASSA